MTKETLSKMIAMLSPENSIKIKVEPIELVLEKPASWYTATFKNKGGQSKTYDTPDAAALYIYVCGFLDAIDLFK